MCGEVFQPRASKHIYCSDACVLESRRTDCAGCGDSFLPTRTDRTSYCSRDCAVQASRKPPKAKPAPKPRPCLTCGEGFMGSRARYCGDECRKEMARRKARQRNSRTKGSPCYTCKECRATFTPEYGNKRRTFCSDICARRWDSRGQDGDYRKRARKYGVAYEYINKRKVYRRDGWCCGICGGRIDRKAKYPDPMSPSLDHIVPLSRGGGHLYRNVQAAHLRCNTDKGAGSAGEQLLLVG